ncbi:hypothetical protein JAAARDRAFT_41657 [Jaapia argillacea MUCL 33604]|uniref:MI domain-containing protein n=1 Tax=Jaapia argillacea MUCL 33604 TaxID=933084 RepID=A0A067PAK8_9AGAM|nr:hypothetical protein JAAARDRAFT_41657 [Jaapia argillacea MUCL 33604]
MSKASTGSASKPLSQLSSKSAWAKGPPQSSASNPIPTPPRTQSPAPTPPTPVSATHSRRSSTLTGAKDGVMFNRSTASAIKQSAAVTFGSIDDASAPISSSPASTPVIKAETVRSFGSVPANQTNGKQQPSTSSSAGASSSNGGPSSSSSTPPTTMHKPHSINKMDIKKMFQNPSSSSPPISSSPSDSPSPSIRPGSLPPPPHQHQQHHQQHSSQGQQPSQPHHPQHAPPTPSSQPSQLPSSYTPFIPSAGFRQQPTQPVPGPPPPQQQQPPPPGPGQMMNVPGGGQQQPPRSPVFPRQMPNGTPGAGGGAGGRVPSGPAGPGGVPPTTNMAAGMPSPRMTPHPHPGTPAGLPPQQVPVPGWGYYYPYVPGMPTEHYMPQYGAPWHMPPPPQHMPGPPHQQQHQHHPPPPQGPPGPPHSGMATMSPRNAPPPLPPGTPTQAHAVPVAPHVPHPPPSIVPPTNVSSPPPTPSSSSPSANRSLNSNASTFVPRVSKAISIKSPTGDEVDLQTLKQQQPPVMGGTPSIVSPPASANPARRSVVRMESEETRRKRVEDEERKERVKKETEERERKRKERVEKEAAERKRKEEDEKIRVKKEKEEKERKLKEEEEARIKKAEEERLKKEEEERKKKEEEERLRKEEEEKERVRKEEEEKERIRKEGERIRLEAEEKEKLEKERLRLEEERQQKLKLEEEERLRKEEEEKERLRKEEEEKERERLRKEAIPPPAPVSEPIAEVPKEVEDGEVLEEAPKTAPTPPQEKQTEENKKPLRIDTDARRRPGPLDLSSTKQTPISAPLPSALATARIIEDLGRVSYPEGIMSPKPELNVNAKNGKFRYDREFLLQFMSICKEKPDHLPPLDAIGLEPVDQSQFTMSRGGSGRRQASGAMGPPPMARQASIGLGLAGSFGKAAGAGFTMGNFATPAGKMSSEERFQMSRQASQGGPGFRPPPMVRTSSQGGPGTGGRTRSKRGEKRSDANRVSSQSNTSAPSYNQSFGQGNMGMQPLEPVAPLQPSANRWTPIGTRRDANAESPELVERKVKALLNKLTMEKFDSISDQIIEWANKSEKEQDGRTLIQVIKLVFEKATDEAAWSEMYARLCRKMMEQISPKVQDEGIKNNEGKPITGGQLFRKYLLNRCQEDFERGWAAKESTAAAAASKATEDAATTTANEGNEQEEAALYSEEYYAAQKAKRQGLGLVKFIGELFKLQMLTERIMHECIKKLLSNVENPEEEEIESLCKLLTTVGQLLDTPKTKQYMDIYFTRMRELVKNPKVSSRMTYMLQDLVELRERKWIPRSQLAAPSTISQVHEHAARDKANAERQNHERQMASMSRGGSRRGHERGGDQQQHNADGWTTTGRPPAKAGDLSNFGKISKTTTPTTFMGPGSIFVGKKGVENKRDSSISRVNSSSNMFHMLQSSEIAAEGPPPAKASRPPSRKASIDMSQGGEPQQRRKLQLLPRSVPVASEKEPDTPGASAPPSEEEELDAGEPSMTEDEAQAKIAEDSKEFFAIRDLGEAEDYFTKLPMSHRFRLVDALVMKAIESKEADAKLVGDLFAIAVSKGLCTADAFEEGFIPVAELLDDIAIDAPKAFNLMAIMMKGAGLDRDEERRTRIAGKSMDSDKLLSLLS